MPTPRPPLAARAACVIHAARLCPHGAAMLHCQQLLVMAEPLSYKSPAARADAAIVKLAPLVPPGARHGLALGMFESLTPRAGT
eukprot:scaffold940_cov569-Prasinococcus_capsulatus_cf.AAC.18